MLHMIHELLKQWIKVAVEFYWDADVQRVLHGLIHPWVLPEASWLSLLTVLFKEIDHMVTDSIADLVGFNKVRCGHG